MKIDINTGQLYTDTGSFLKQLDCPLSVAWKEMQSSLDGKGKTCNECNKFVYDTTNINDADLELLIKRDPKACLKISLSQNNCTVIPPSIIRIS